MRRTCKLLLIAVMLAFAVSATGADAQEDLPRERVVLWSLEGPVAVERSVALSASLASPTRAERLMQALLEGPTSQEAAQGLRTAIPEDTTLGAVSTGPSGSLEVRLDIPRRELDSIDEQLFERIHLQVRGTLQLGGINGVHLLTKDPVTGSSVPLDKFVPHVEPAPKPGSVDAQRAQVPHSTPMETTLEAPQAAGEGPAPGQAQPQGALSGKTVYVSAGHGWQYNGYTWSTQRPPYPNEPYEEPIIEDHNNAEAVNQYLLNYLWNAGAQVWPVRERDMNNGEKIVDNDDPGPDAGYSDTGGWRTTLLTGTGFDDSDYRWAETTTGSASAVATWTASLPADGRYAVYVWYRPGEGRASDARYTVHHAGGDTTVRVDQRIHGHTWRYIGTYGFLSSQQARVTLTNESDTAGQAVIADAVRFGGGTFDSPEDIEGAPYAPYKPWWETAAFYYTQRMGMEAASGDSVSRPDYACWEHRGTGDDAVFVSWHSNGLTGYQDWASGTESYIYYGSNETTEGSAELQVAIHEEIVRDIRSGWDPEWKDRGMHSGSFLELSTLYDSHLDSDERQIPGVLVEIAYHDHPGDTDALKHPRFNQIVARAMYQGIVKYFDQRDSSDRQLLPEPPMRVAVNNVGDGSLQVSWQPRPTDSLDLAGDAPTGYRVYTSTNGIGWSNGMPVDGTSARLTDIPDGTLIYVRVTATNNGGESFPTETLAARVGESSHVLLVNGFDRLNDSMLVQDIDPAEGSNWRMLLDQMNSFDYVVQHGEAIPYAFDSATNGAVRHGVVELGDYAVVDWILGEESVQDETFGDTEQALLKTYLDAGNGLFVSGSEVAYDLDFLGDTDDRQFYRNVLRAKYEGDDADTHEVKGLDGGFAGLSFRFDEPGMYDADYPDQLTPNGSTAVLAYGSGGEKGTAGVQYADGCERVVNFGFPFETIRTAEKRGDVMEAVLDFVMPEECTPRGVNTSIQNPSNGSAHAETPTFDGTAQAEQGTLERVQVAVQDASDGTYWNGTSWAGTEKTWLEASGTDAWSYSLPSSLGDGSYRLWARAWADGLPDESPAEVTFVHDTVKPDTPELVAPSEGAEIAALPQLVLDWTDESDSGSPVSYRVELDGQVSDTSSSSHATRTGEGVHEWRVRARDAAGNESPWTELWDFSVKRQHAWLPLVTRVWEEPSPECHNVVVNGGFESDDAWALNNLAVYQSDQTYSGARSVRVGIPPGTTGAHVYSSVSQGISLPPGSSATLRMRVYPISESSDSGDLHYVFLHDEWGDSHPLDTTTVDTRAWTHRQYTQLTDFLGQTVTIRIGALNDGDDDTAAAYVDEVELEVCP